MIPAGRHTDTQLDRLIDEITVDCHDEYEQLTAFETAFDNDATLPCPGTVVGERVEVLSVSGPRGSGPASGHGTSAPREWAAERWWSRRFTDRLYRTAIEEVTRR